MMIVAIGSYALQKRIPSVKVGKDIDLIMTYETYERWLAHMKQTSNVLSHYPISNGKKMVVKTSVVENPASCDVQIFEIEIAWSGSTAEEFMDIVYHDKDTMFQKKPYGYTLPSLNVASLFEK